MASYERLQGAMWHAQKDNMKLVDVKTSHNNNIKGFYRHTISGNMFTHWMNDNEKMEYIKINKEEMNSNEKR